MTEGAAGPRRLGGRSTGEAARRGRRQLADDAARAAEATAVVIARAVVVGERAPDDVLLAEAALARWSRTLRGV